VQRRTFLAASAATLAAPMLAQAQSQRTLKFIPQADLAVLDPVWTTATVTQNHGFLVFDTLYGQTGPEGGHGAVPQMLAGHSVEDGGRTWRLTLRDGLLFHDGQRVLARDCVASIRRWGVRDGFGQALMARTDALSAQDDRTILFRLKAPFALLPDALATTGGNMCAIMPERLASTDPYKQVTEMVGSGPYRFKADERVPGDHVAYERFAAYKPRPDGTPDMTTGPKVAHFDRVEWHVISDAATASAALQAGEVDWWELPTADLLPMLQQNKQLRMERVYSLGGAGVLRPNHLFPPFDNPAIRRALLGAIDQTEFMTAVNGNDHSLWKVPCGFFPIGAPMASDAGMTALTGPRDLAKVKQEVKAAGYKGERIVLLGAVDFPIIKPLGDVTADLLSKLDMNVDYQATDWGTLVQRRASKKPPAQGGWNLFCTYFPGLSGLTPATNLGLRANGQQAWFGWPDSPKLEALRNQWLDATDLETQKEIAAEIQTQAFVDVPYYPLGMAYGPTAYRADLTGILRGFPIFWNIRRTRE
jgi:peptide/nickel transport system substrate-binding protein